MHVPEGWIEAEQPSNPGPRSLRRFHPDHQEDTSLGLFYRGHPVSTEAGKHFHQILGLPAHVLNAQETLSLEQVLNFIADPEVFELRSAQTMELNGRTVLRVRGLWKEGELESLGFFIDADGTGEVVQQIFFEAPKLTFQHHKEAAMAALKSIEWV